MSARSGGALLVAFGVVFSLGGCIDNSKTEMQREITRLNDVVKDKDNQLVAQQSTIAELNRQIDAARGLSKADLEKLVHPERLVIGSLSGGEDYDGQPGDDGITVYLQPTDKEGDALKVAGSMKVELYDLANPPDENLLGIYEIPVEQAGELWYGKLMTYHYTVKCPWPKGRKPKHPDITVRATFIDFLTRRVMTAQGEYKVKLAP